VKYRKIFKKDIKQHYYKTNNISFTQIVPHNAKNYGRYACYYLGSTAQQYGEQVVCGYTYLTNALPGSLGFDNIIHVSPDSGRERVAKFVHVLLLLLPRPLTAEYDGHGALAAHHCHLYK
jgi:hypothetical protein